MHPSSLRRMQWFVDTYLPPNSRGPSRRSVLDVGSYDVNGTYRELFDEGRFHYTGLDMEAGPNVDLVPRSPYCWDEIGDDSHDVVISGQALEHIEFFWLTVAEMVRVLRQDGLLCIIAPNGFGEHRYPVDCYRFFTDGMIALARYTRLEILHAHTNCCPADAPGPWCSDDEADAILIARKPYAGPPRLIDPRAYTCVPADHADLRGPLVPCPAAEEPRPVEPRPIAETPPPEAAPAQPTPPRRGLRQRLAGRLRALLGSGG